MRRSIAIILPFFVAACGAADIDDVPPLSIGGSTPGFMTDTSNPVDAYATAHARLTSLHTQLRHFTKAPANTYSASITAGQLVDAITLMQELIEEPKKSELQPILDWYRDVKSAVEWGRFGGSYAGNLDMNQQKLRSGFSPSAVTIVAKSPKPDKTPGGTTATPPAPGDTTKPPPEPTKPPSDVPLWMLFNAWKQSHADLIEAFAKKADAGKAYRRLRESVGALKARVPGEKQQKLALGEATYEQQNDETKGFTALPAGAKDEDVLRVLRLVGDMIEKEYNPDRK